MVTSKIEIISPEQASKYLAMSGGNRNISSRVVLGYAKQMENGSWMLNGDSIKISQTGKLIDGHHRLHACIKAGVPFETIVINGVDDNCFTTYDCGRHRTLGQLISIDGKKNYNLVAAGVAICHKLENNRIYHGGGADPAIDNNTLLMNYYKENEDLFSTVGSFISGVSDRIRCLRPSLSVGIMSHLIKNCGYDYPFVAHFFDNVYSLDSSDNITIDTLRKRLIQDFMDKKHKPQISVTVALTIKTWNAYVRGRELKRISFNPIIEDYPEFIINKKNIFNL